MHDVVIMLGMKPRIIRKCRDLNRPRHYLYSALSRITDAENTWRQYCARQS